MTGTSNKKKIQELWELYSTIHNRLISFSMGIGKKYAYSCNSEAAAGLRSSLYFRLRSLIYHYEHLFREKRAYEINLNNAMGPEIDYRDADSSVGILTYLFDDIVFNTISLFDYTGSLISVIVNGQHPSLPWPEWFRLERGKNSILASFFEDPLVKEHYGFICNLYSYRNHISYSKSYGLRFNHSYTLASEEQIELSIYMPERFVELLHEASLTGPQDLIELTKGLELFLKHSFGITDDILKLTFTHLKGTDRDPDSYNQKSFL